MHRQNKRSATHKKNGVRKINGGYKGMTLEEIEAKLEKEITRAGDLFRNLVALKHEITAERQKRERAELHLIVKRRGRPSKFLQNIPTLEEQGLVSREGETDSAQEAQQ